MSSASRLLCYVLMASLLLGISLPTDARDEGQAPYTHPLFVKALFDDIDDGEFFTIFNPCQETIDISNWSISDGEGILHLANGIMLPPNSELTVARSYSSYLRQNKVPPDCSIIDNIEDPPFIRMSGSFRLSNNGDELVLRNSKGDIVDGIAFGDSSDISSMGNCWQGGYIPSPGRGSLITRQRNAEGYIDTNSKSDWLALRVYRPGQSDFSPLEANATVTPLILPEHSNMVLTSLRAAKTKVRICTYEFDSRVVTALLENLIEEGIKVEILIEGSPVGGLKGDSILLLDRLSNKGATIFEMRSPLSGDAVRRYPYLHSKYLVIDSDVSIILSENLVADVFDIELGHGNRGSGAIIVSEQVASYLDMVFRADAHSGFPDVICRDAESQESLNSSGNKLDSSFPKRLVSIPPSSACRVRLMPFPDVSDVISGIEKLISVTERSLLVEVFYADHDWKTPMMGMIINPILSLIKSKMGSLEEFIFCLDGSWLSSKNGCNADVIDALSSSRESRPEKFYLGFQNKSAPFSIVHNKGFVIDHRYSIISSVNWGFESACSNRELAVLIDDATIARFFENNIRRDVFGDSDPPRLLPRFSFSPEGDTISVSISPESDESGLRSVTITADGNRRSNWSMEISLDHPPRRIEIEAFDLWGNRADMSVVPFPTSNELVIGQSFAGTLVSIFSSAGMAYAIISSFRLWLRMKKTSSRI